MKFLLLYLGDERRTAEIPAHEFDREEAVACARRRMQLEAEALRDLRELSAALLASAEAYAIEIRPVYVW